MKNAQALEQNGAAIVLDEKESNYKDLINAVSNTILSSQTLKRMKDSCLSMSAPNATNQIANESLSLMHNV